MLAAIMRKIGAVGQAFLPGYLTNCGTPKLWELERQARAAGGLLEPASRPDSRPPVRGTIANDDLSEWSRARRRPIDPPESERMGPRDEGD
jgi:hypothetical protein